MKNYVIKVKQGSTDEVRVKKILKGMGVGHNDRVGVLGTTYVSIEVEPEVYDVIKNKLDLTEETIYCNFRELVEES